ncbi:MAG: type II toxin-antitoxin system RelE/ParE family toxin [Bacteroidetes bacterium]|nr:type II toxin-antitoxin system RelE/ParE family toxin [Bacteroidota bacterium]
MHCEPGRRLSVRMVRSTRPNGNHLKNLRGDRKGQSSIRINKQYRICFHWTVTGPESVEIADSHE